MISKNIILLLLSSLVFACGSSSEQISSVVEEETAVVEEETAVVEEETAVVEEETAVVEEETAVVEEETAVVEEETAVVEEETALLLLRLLHLRLLPQLLQFLCIKKVKSLMFLLSKHMTKTVLLKYLVNFSNVK